MSEKHLSSTEYSSLPLCEGLQQGIQEAGFTFCTPIQALTLPITLTGKDVSGQAQTGTGKTAAFLISVFETLHRNAEKQVPEESAEAEPSEALAKNDDEPAEGEEAQTEEPKKKAPSSKKNNNPIKALVIAPTRELAKQIYDDAKPLNKYLKYNLALAYGGTDYDKQRDVIAKGCDVLIGTPGRIIDFYKQNCYSLNDLQVLVMDEADRMFDMGFIKDIRFLLRAMPAPSERQSLLFSATMSERVKELAYEHMDSPETVIVESENLTADKVEEQAFMPANEEKIPLAIGIIKQEETNKSIVFCNTKYKCEELQNWLTANDIKSGLLSGDVPQKKRESLLKQFKENKIQNLVATDVAARGLHIDQVDTVINFDLPNDAEDYVHRIGRTARAGASGRAMSFICETFGMNIVDIETYIDHKIEINKDYGDLISDDLIPGKKAERKRPADRKGNSKKPQGRKPNAKPHKSEFDKPKHHKTETKISQPDDIIEGTANRYMRRSSQKKEIPAIG